jgi:glycosyltransferase involved in cell wall biosynthesis
MKVLYVQYANPGAYPPLEHSSRILAEMGWHVLALGIGLRGTEALRFAPHPNIEIRLLKYCPPGWRQKLHFTIFGLWTLGWVLRWRPKWIYASDPFSCPIALALTFLPGLRVVYHEHDSPNQESGKRKAGIRKTESAEQTRHLTPALSPNEAERERKSDFRFPISDFQKLILWCRKKLAQRAGFCILPNEKRIEVFKEQTGTTGPVLCVWNCPRKEEAIAPSELRTPNSELRNFVVFYHGSIVPARVPLTVLQAISQLQCNVRFQMAGYETIGNRGYIAALQAEAVRLGIRERFEYLGAFAREELLPLCRKADVGLSLMPNTTSDLNEQAMTGASNKPFDYLACGVPLLVSDLPEWRKMFVEAGYALACNPGDPQSIAEALRWFIEHPEETRQMGERGCDRILKEWNYEAQFAPVVAGMEF